MTIAALIIEGIGPGGSIKYVMTGGLDISSTIPSRWTPAPAAIGNWVKTIDDTQIWTPQIAGSATWTPQ